MWSWLLKHEYMNTISNCHSTFPKVTLYNCWFDCMWLFLSKEKKKIEMSLTTCMCIWEWKGLTCELTALSCVCLIQKACKTGLYWSPNRSLKWIECTHLYVCGVCCTVRNGKTVPATHCKKQSSHLFSNPEGFTAQTVERENFLAHFSVNISAEQTACESWSAVCRFDV